MVVDGKPKRFGRAFVRQVFAFASVSVATTVLDFALFNVLIGFDVLSPLVANTISYGAGIVASYVLNKRITFSGGGRANRGHEVGLFLVLNLVGLGINNGAVALAARGADESTLLINAVKLLAGVATWVLKFVTFKYWVYPHRPDASSATEPASS
jgi:putative flippase GtrA